jgi:hypothetical protein
MASARVAASTETGGELGSYLRSKNDRSGRGVTSPSNRVTCATWSVIMATGAGSNDEKPRCRRPPVLRRRHGPLCYRQRVSDVTRDACRASWITWDTRPMIDRRRLRGKRTANGTLGEGKAGDRVQDRGLPPFRVCGAPPSRLLCGSSVRSASIPGRRTTESWWSGFGVASREEDRRGRRENRSWVSPASHFSRLGVPAIGAEWDSLGSYPQCPPAVKRALCAVRSLGEAP